MVTNGTSTHPDVVFKIRDISKKGGGKLQTGTNKYHKSHQIGLDCDLQLLVNGVRINTLKSSYTVKQRGFLRDFIKIVLANPVLNIKVIGCTESVLAKEFEKVRAKGWNGHNKHLHVRFCVPEKYRSQLKRIAVPPISYYDCKPAQNEIDDSYELFDSEDFFDEEVPLPEAELLSAIQYNRIKMVSLGWQKYFDDIVMHILKLNYSPNEEAFAQAIAQWQADNGLDDDGKVGPGTWGKFKKLLGIGSAKPKTPDQAQRFLQKNGLEHG